jgi:hypothetical protein
MYARLFRRADQTRRFTITNAGSAGWEVRAEEDSRVIWSVRYTDWHRVERARMEFSRQAATLEHSGWIETA